MCQKIGNFGIEINFQIPLFSYSCWFVLLQYFLCIKLPLQAYNHLYISNFDVMPAIKNALLRYRIIDRAIRNEYIPYPSKKDLRQLCEDEFFAVLIQFPLGLSFLLPGLANQKNQFHYTALSFWNFLSTKLRKIPHLRW